MTKLVFIVTTLLLTAAAASAEVRSIDITVFGMD